MQSSVTCLGLYFVISAPQKCGAWWFIGRVESLLPEGRDFQSQSSRHIYRNLEQVLHLQMPAAIWRVNSVIDVVGSASERLVLWEAL